MIVSKIKDDIYARPAIALLQLAVAQVAIGMLRPIGLPAHIHFHCATTMPPSRDLAGQALLFLNG